MQVYGEMVDSGVDWLGDIPAKWSLSKISVHFRRKKIRGMIDEELLSVYRDYGVVIKSSRDDNHNTASEDLSNYQLVEPGDLVTNKMKTWQGSIAISEHRGIVSPAYFILSPLSTGQVPKYVHYLLRSPIYIAQYGRYSKGIRIGQWDLEYEQFKTFPLLLPSEVTQQNIVDYLDTETAKIDALIAKQEQLLKLLEEKRRATITHSVTRGLDPLVELKKTNIAWLGKIPRHWHFEKNKYHIIFSKGLNITKADLSETGIPVISYGQVHSKYPVYFDPNNDVLPFVPESYLDVKNARMQKGDFIFADTSEDYNGSGNFSMLTSDATVLAGYHSIVARLKDRSVLPKYQAYYFASEQHRNQVRAKVSGVKVYSISQGLLSNTLSLLPPIVEQQAIVRFLDKHIEASDILKSKIKTQIALLRERRTSIISHAVTGKIKI